MKRIANGIYLDPDTLEVLVSSWVFRRMFREDMSDKYRNLTTTELTKEVETTYGSTGVTGLIELGELKGTPVRLHLVEKLKELTFD